MVGDQKQEMAIVSKDLRKKVADIAGSGFYLPLTFGILILTIVLPFVWKNEKTHVNLTEKVDRTKAMYPGDRSKYELVYA